MRTLKTALVVVGLLAVLYGAYVVINRPGTLPFSFFNQKKPGEGAADPDAPSVSGPVASAGYSAKDKSADSLVAPIPSAVPIEPAPGAIEPEGPRDPAPVQPNPNDTPLVPFQPAPGPLPNRNPSGGLIDTPQPESHQPQRSHGLVAFQRAWGEAKDHLAKGYLPDALRTLTPFYNSADISPEDRAKLADLLDRLAGTVIYSKQHHLLEQPCKVTAGQNLIDIAKSYKVPWELLARINNIPDPKILYPGEELKVLRGPFKAVVHLEQKELVLQVQDCYAGRMPISIGNDPPPREGIFDVVRKIAPDDPANPAGRTPVIDLGGLMTIYGDNGSGRGSVAVSNRDATDLYFILTEGKSGVVIKK